MSRQYYTLIIKEPGDTNWTPQFGDYKHAVVAQEWRDTKKDWPKGTGCQIIKTGDGKAAVEEGIAAINKLQAQCDAAQIEPEEKRIHSPTVIRYDENDVPHEVTSELYVECVEKKKVGDLLCSFAGAPGTGRIVERITRIDATGVYGVTVENTIRELDPSEVR